MQERMMAKVMVGKREEGGKGDGARESESEGDKERGERACDRARGLKEKRGTEREKERREREVERFAHARYQKTARKPFGWIQ